MKRIERNTYNSIKRNTTADTINVEIPVEYSHEARQAIHEYLTINGMRVTGINWNSIQECYCIHWEPARTETAEAIRRQQENADIDDVTKGMEYSDWTWNGYRKPQEAPTTAPAADPDQQPTTTENAPQAATQAAEEPTNDEQKEDENTMSNTTTKPTATPEAAAILAINPAIFKGLHIKLGFDFQQPVTICRIPAPFTIKKAWKLAADHDPTTSTAAIIMRDTGNTWGIYRDLHMAPITADNLRDDYDDHSMSYSLGRAHGYKTVFSTFFSKGSFHDLRKAPTCEAWIIAQRNDLLKPWTEPARDWTERQRDMTPGEHPQPCRVYYANRRPVYLIDKSNYRIDARREDLKRRAAKLRADRQKAAADDATRATAARRYNDLLKAFNDAKQRIITALVNVDPLTLSPATVAELEIIGKAIGEYAWKGLSGAARDINQFEAAARENKFTTPARYDAAYNAIVEKLAAILPEDADTAKEAV